jgi:hypothetical protein
MRTNLSMPAAAIIPVLEYPGVPAAVKWLTEAFAFEVRLQIGAHRAHLQFGGGAIVVSESNSPGAAPGSGHSVMVRVEAIDVHRRGPGVMEPGSFASSRTFPTANANTPASIRRGIHGRSPRRSETSTPRNGAARSRPI